MNESKPNEPAYVGTMANEVADLTSRIVAMGKAQAASRDEVGRLRGMLRQLLQHRGYVYVAQPTDYICSHCGGQWEMRDRERHGDDCPVALAKAEVGAPAGTAAMRHSLLMELEEGA